MIPFPAAEYRAAVVKETVARDFAFLGVSEDVCGVAVRPMTLRDFIRLDGIESPFVRGGLPSPNDIVLFLWLQSKQFKPSAFALWRFSRRCRNLNYVETVKAITAFIDDALMDAPGGSGKSGESFYSMAAGLVDWLASNYGWSEEAILDCPLKRLFQYVNASVKRKNPKAILFNPLSGKVRRDYLKALNRN
jgi:hypothetical protein